MKILPLLLFLLLIVSYAAAVTITERPDTIGNGQPMYITILDLPEGASFSLLVESASDVQPGSEFTFQMSQFVMPFSLRKSSVTATLSGTSQNTLEVMKESTIVTVSGKSADGHFSTTKTYDITRGTYDYFRLSGISLPTSRSISAQLQVTGTKQGPDDSEISFVVEGLTTGSITTAVVVDGRQVFYKTIPVGGSTPSSGGTSPSGSSPSTTAPPPEQWTTYTSADGQASITLSQAGSVGFLKVPAENVTPGMKVISGPYSLVPQDTTYLPKATLQFQIPPGTHLSGLAVATLTGDTWTLLSSKIENSTMSATIGSSGTYVLLGPDATPATTVPTTTIITTVPTTTASSNTVPPTKTGLESFTLILAMGTGCLVMLVKKR